MLIIGLRIFILLIIGMPVIIIFSRFLKKILTHHFNAHIGILFQKAVFIFGVTLIIITILYELGYNLSAILGAAGIASVAIGFAAQTSLSNIISGIFLYWERPFQVSDIIRVGDTTGTVLTIDLLSIKLRTFDNLFIRIPNETIIKGQVTTVTRYPIRRMDINIGVAYKEDIENIMRILKDVAKCNPYSLDEPEPIVVFKDFAESSLLFMLGLWFEKSQFLDLKNSIMRDIKNRFDKEGVEIPFPHISLYSGSATEPFPISIVNQKK